MVDTTLPGGSATSYQPVANRGASIKGLRKSSKRASRRKNRRK